MTTSLFQKSFLVVSLAAAGLLAVAYFEQRSETAKVREENERLRSQMGKQAVVDEAQAAIAAAHKTARVTIDETVSGVEEPSSQAAPVVASPISTDPEMVLTPTGLAAEPRNDGLDLVDTTAVETATGIRTTMRFLPTITDPVGIVAVVVRLPGDGEARIQDLAMTGSMKYAEVAKRISEDGKFAVMQINAEMVEDLQVELDVDSPVTADVRGTAGIGPYDLQIGFGTVTVVKK